MPTQKGESIMKFVRCCYLSTDDKRRFPHQLRDGDAALQLFEALKEARCEHGDLFINWPCETGTTDTSIADFNQLGMKENDILLYHPDLRTDCGPDQPKCDTSINKQYRHVKVTVADLYPGGIGSKVVRGVRAGAGKSLSC